VAADDVPDESLDVVCFFAAPASSDGAGDGEGVGNDDIAMPNESSAMVLSSRSTRWTTKARTQSKGETHFDGTGLIERDIGEKGLRFDGL
jgi:hypothetical protein